MKILGIESSCDDTAVAVVENGRTVIGSQVSSQAKIHSKFGGVIPEVASRKHIETIIPLIDELFRKTKLQIKDIDAIAVTQGPGLLGSLLIGLNTAKTLAYVWKKPLITVDHLAGHIYSNWLEKEPIKKFPVLSLIVSGGHTDIVLLQKNKVITIGGTRDDAAGEAFDKAAKLLGLGYPGGPIISKIAKQGKAPRLPRPMIDDNNLEMSFSGLKTALARVVNNAPKTALAYEFQTAMIDVLISKLKRAINKYHPKTLMLAGGVAANPALRLAVGNLADKSNLELKIPELKYCMDNAAMIASAGYYLRRQYGKNKKSAMSADVFTNSTFVK